MEDNSLLDSSSPPSITIIPASTLPSDPTTSPLATSCLYDANLISPPTNDDPTTRDSPGKDFVFYTGNCVIDKCCFLLRELLLDHAVILFGFTDFDFFFSRPL